MNQEELKPQWNKPPPPPLNLLDTEKCKRWNIQAAGLLDWFLLIQSILWAEIIGSVLLIDKPPFSIKLTYVKRFTLSFPFHTKECNRVFIFLENLFCLRYGWPCIRSLVWRMIWTLEFHYFLSNVRPLSLFNNALKDFSIWTQHLAYETTIDYMQS